MYCTGVPRNLPFRTTILNNARTDVSGKKIGESDLLIKGGL